MNTKHSLTSCNSFFWSSTPSRPTLCPNWPAIQDVVHRSHGFHLQHFEIRAVRKVFEGTGQQPANLLRYDALDGPGRVAYPRTDGDRHLVASAPHRQHADEHAHTERDPNGLIRMLANSLVGSLSGSSGLVLQPFANLFGFLNYVFQFYPQFTLLVLGFHTI